MNKQSRPPEVNVRLITTAIYENSTVQLTSVGLAQACPNYLVYFVLAIITIDWEIFTFKNNCLKNFLGVKILLFHSIREFFNSWREFTLPV